MEEETFSAIEKSIRDGNSTEAELLAVLTARISEMLEQTPEQLMSLLYRLDVEERKMASAMHPAAPEPPAVGLARLVLERQQQRAATKKQVKVEPLDLGEEWRL